MKEQKGVATRRVATVLATILAIHCAEAATDLIPMPREIAETGGTCPAGAEVRVEKVAGIPAEGYELFVATTERSHTFSPASPLPL